MNVIILSTSEGFSRGVLTSFFKNGKHGFYMIGTKEVKKIMLSRYCKKFFEIELDSLINGDESIFEVIKAVKEEYSCEMVIPACIYSTYYLGRKKEQLENLGHVFPLSNYETLKTLHNKWDLYTYLKEIMPRSLPETFLFNGENHFLQETPPYPLITKPLEMEGGENIKIANDEEELKEILVDCPLPLLVQEFIPGYDIDLSVLALNGKIKAWTIQRLKDGHYYFQKNTKVLELGEKIISAMNFSGLAHFDMRVDERDSSIKVIECNPRVWSSINHSCYAGVNFIKLALYASLSKNIRFKEAMEGRTLSQSAILNTLKKGTLTFHDLKIIFKNHLFALISDPIYTLHENLPVLDRIWSRIAYKKKLVMLKQQSVSCNIPSE